MAKLIILPGWGHDSSSWQEIVAKIDPQWQTEIIELPGFGAEPLINKDWGVPDYVAWVVERLRNQEDLVLLGHSFGGRIAAEIAGKKLLPLKGLILYGAPVLYRPSAEAKWKMSLASVVKKFVPANIRQRFYSADLRQAAEMGMEQIFRKTVVFDQTGSLRQINIPTFMIWGDQDTEAPVATAKEAERLIHGSQLQLLPGLGHNAHLENPILFYGTLNNVLKNLA